MKPDEAAPLAHDRDRPNSLSAVEVDRPGLDAKHGGGRRVDGDLWASARGARHFDACPVKLPPDAL
jgi:hypothetical protein